MATIQPPTPEEEDAIIHSRITNDEKVLKKVVKRFHTYASVAYPLHLPETRPEPLAIEEAKELFRVELESFHLTLKKAVLVCEAERRQVEQYEREKQRIEDEREALKGQIEQLKTSLEDAQLSRRQMIEYDLIAEKINQLPSRDELQQSIDSLENDIAAILSEHETQTRLVQAQKTALDTIINDISSLRLLGKDPDLPQGDTSGEDSQDLPDDEKFTEDPSLNPAAKPFTPSRFSTPIAITSIAQRQLQSKGIPSGVSSPLVSSPILVPTKDDDDIEMGELAEEPGEVKSPKKVREELEEGEASDGSSPLSAVPDYV
ncbi:hypothetical protein BDM02DRAFT_3189801 [Thelephora ganbajun]|uniref:Uncharacterized protein n=1 Tax=Thelephora ganbajun TaxID=370292 RepID=A0ACB6Z6J6_THEGA|nr:hypothetical protein BDM02DRAFT_3189801 [Thelephora ganbajun]